MVGPAPCHRLVSRWRAPKPVDLLDLITGLRDIATCSSLGESILNATVRRKRLAMARCLGEVGSVAGPSRRIVVLLAAGADWRSRAAKMTHGQERQGTRPLARYSHQGQVARTANWEWGSFSVGLRNAEVSPVAGLGDVQ